MNASYNEKTNELTITISVNPKSTQLSTSGKTYMIGSDGGKINLAGVEVRAQVNVYRPAEEPKKKGKK